CHIRCGMRPRIARLHHFYFTTDCIKRALRDGDELAQVMAEIGRTEDIERALAAGLSRALRNQWISINWWMSRTQPYERLPLTKWGNEPIQTSFIYRRLSAD